jgi:endonuclease/exonuclease/phosphatase family metal-dependent hydrolase
MSRYFLAFWNLENLFAPEGFPEREPWIAEAMKADLKGWTTELFERKIGQLQRIIAMMNDGGGPDLLGVCEVENRFCLDALVAALNAALPARRYAVIHADSTKDHRGIDTAFLFDSQRLSVDPNTFFHHFVMRRTGTRDISQATFTTASGQEFVAFCNHWPSRSGSTAEDSQGFRATAGETLGYWHERVREERGADIPVIAFGDMNDDPHDRSITIHANATRERDDVENSTSARFYNLTWRYLTQEAQTASGSTRTLYGTLYYKDNGNVFDQIFVSRALLRGPSRLRVIDESARIEAFAEMVAASKNLGPIRFGLPRGDVAKNVNRDGFSDHFPISVLIEESGVS